MLPALAVLLAVLLAEFAEFAELAEAEFKLWGISRVKSVRGGWGQLPLIPTISSYTMLLVATIYHPTPCAFNLLSLYPVCPGAPIGRTKIGGDHPVAGGAPLAKEPTLNPDSH